MSIAIDQAEQTILAILPNNTKILAGEINTMGSFLIFDSIKINNAHISDVDYVFNLFIAISSKAKNNRLVYTPLNDALNALVIDYQTKQKVELGQISPYSLKGLIVYQVKLIVKGFENVEFSY